MQTLTGTWKLAADPDNIGREQRWFDRVQVEAQDAPVPGVIQQVFPGYHGVAWYWHTFELMRGVAASPDERALLQFGAVDYLAEVWINGSYAGTCEGGETPFEFDITDALKKSGPNLLAVRVLNPTNDAIDGYVLKQTPHRCKVVPMKNGATFNSGGIMYAVQLCIVPAVHTSVDCGLDGDLVGLCMEHAAEAPPSEGSGVPEIPSPVSVGLPPLWEEEGNRDDERRAGREVASVIRHMMGLRAQDGTQGRLW